ncbi:hypothetical protein [Tessaracoccus palaemonis]|uniref:Thioesterase domain-containing protein n=1 Tax=Tessaracoccus palaemonis TaxID=2829499 RepID=A0ABX8SI57_9ACTN|nr:hypothetical protein [Tessaracoccus palaemonis]QXT62990.1 hypothetical protein KDB89_00405 [Tessaracoccus palaemonis]
MRCRRRAACPRLPLSYFDYRIAPPTDWVTGPNAYLAFGATYVAQLEFALAEGWPQARIAGAHLHFLHEPETVAARIRELAVRLPCGTSPR